MLEVLQSLEAQQYPWTAPLLRRWPWILLCLKRLEDLQHQGQRSVAVHLVTVDTHVRSVQPDTTEIPTTDLRDLLENVLNVLAMITNSLAVRNKMEECNVFVRMVGQVHIATLERGRMYLLDKKPLSWSQYLSRGYKL